MAESNSPAEAFEFPQPALPRLAPLGELPADFTPLRLVLEPAGLVLELKYPDMVMGRHSEADVRLPLPDVSRRHCRLYFAAGRWHVQDLKSMNGVFVNEEMVDRVELRHGDRLRIGGFGFNVRLTPETAEDPASLVSRLMHAAPQLKPSSQVHRRAS